MHAHPPVLTWQTSNVTDVVRGPGTLVLQDNESLVGSVREMVRAWGVIEEFTTHTMHGRPLCRPSTT